MRIAHVVGVIPPAAFHSRRRLWGALEEAFPVEFQARQPEQLTGLDAAICQGPQLPPETGLPTLRADGHESRVESATIRLTEDAGLASCLRAQRLTDDRALALAPVEPSAAETVLAERDGKALWVFEDQRGQHRSAALPQELGPQEVLRDRLKAGRFLALLPRLTRLRALPDAVSWSAPPLRAAFVLDDPNLHSCSYGYVNFAALAARAERGGFHLAFATVPLDTWYTNSRAASALRQSPRLSLLVHGNDHIRCELGRGSTVESSLAVVAQALRRIRSFERRTGIAVARVMAPPHGECSPVALEALRRTGFLAACISRPYPWLARPPAARMLAQWELADTVAGLPILPRYSLRASREDVPLRAFLQQPLILYGHQDDLSAGSNLLDEAASEVNLMGDVRWRNPASIARSNFLSRRDGDLLRVRLYTRAADVAVPEGVRAVQFELPGGAEGCFDSDGVQLTGHGRSAVGGLDEPIGVPPNGGRLRVALSSLDAIDIDHVPAPQRQAWPPVRRLLTEGRDRLTPTLDLLREPR
jgi:hypothetical protein